MDTNKPINHYGTLCNSNSTMQESVGEQLQMGSNYSLKDMQAIIARHLSEFCTPGEQNLSQDAYRN
jgi:hypothetical protein